MPANDDSPAALVDAKIRALADWRGEVLSRVRSLVHEADPEVVEEVKWRKPSNPAGVPVWSHDGILCTGEVYKDKVKITFARGAALEDPTGLFNASLDGKVRRAIDLRQGDELDSAAFVAIVRAAVALNAATGGGGGRAGRLGTTRALVGCARGRMNGTTEEWLDETRGSVDEETE